MLRLSEGDDGAQPSNYFNLLAALAFVVNALLCLWDGYLQYHGAAPLNLDYDSQSKDLVITELPLQQQLSMLASNIFFLVAAVSYVITGLWWEDPSLPGAGCYTDLPCSLALNLVGALGYMMAGLFAVVGCIISWRTRKAEGLPPLKWFSCDIYKVDWFAWGDWLYLAACIEPFYQIFMDAPSDEVSVHYFADNVIWLLDAIVYIVGYAAYTYELRESLAVGLMSDGHEAALAAVVSRWSDRQALVTSTRHRKSRKQIVDDIINQFVDDDEPWGVSRMGDLKKISFEAPKGEIERRLELEEIANRLHI